MLTLIFVVIVALGAPLLDLDLGLTGSVIVGLVLRLAWWVICCLIWPNAACRKCHGRPPRSPDGKYWGECRRCHGRGRKRFGARAIRSLVHGSER